MENGIDDGYMMININFQAIYENRSTIGRFVLMKFVVVSSDAVRCNSQRRKGLVLGRYIELR